MTLSEGMSSKRLLLFDIDGTLLDTGGATMSCLEEGFFVAFPQMDRDAYPRMDLGRAYAWVEWKI